MRDSSTRKPGLTDHGEQVRVVDGGVPVLALVEVGPVQDPGHHQTEVRSERVDGHGATGVFGLEGRDGGFYTFGENLRDVKFINDWILVGEYVYGKQSSHKS